ncbi:peptidoglycan editing factor PgeF [Sulfuricurvum sp.]|uniref:peptidoglycan editing factor PgeF n=1 Tax=Sulfuricurvum sp. TaxID=2025608 RepID=UPI0019C483A5|nr:peptidoglycan editing factor PgeF [Sulfuricurvum sp.]MBD3806511.1 peptidoglycan editing factor PgeF [Sulfuricurvum sp.]
MKMIYSQLLSHFSDLTALFTTRHGGVSKAPYASGNLAFHVGDNPSDVLCNHDLLAQSLGYDRHLLVHMRQIHSDHITIIDDSHNFDTPPQCDALITDRKRTPLMVMSADCTPILLYDPAHNAIGAVHAGRAGALNAILPKTINAMHQAFGSQKEDMKIVLGPSIHRCCYEINESIANETEAKGYPNALRKEEGKVFLDVNAILLQQLHEIEIMSDQIEVIDHCTSCRCDEYFSYRADHQHTGRIAGVILLK